jgi:mRNA interferase RelE/StbE
MKQAIHKLRVVDDVAELVRTMHPELKKKFKVTLQMILSNPYRGKALYDELEGLRSFRVSRFRIVYRISTRKQIDIIAIGPRERIYEETLRILSKKKRVSFRGIGSSGRKDIAEKHEELLWKKK